MEIILIIISGTLLAVCFLFAFGLGFAVGMKYAEDKHKEESITITDKNKLAARKYKNFVNFNG